MNLIKLTRLLLLSLLLLIDVGITHSQTLPSILIDGQTVQANPANFPYWLKEGQTLNLGNNVISISVLQYNIAPSTAGGNSLQFESIENVTSLQTVPAGKAWKIEAVALNMAATSFSGDNLGNHVATTDLNMSNYKVWNIANPVNSGDAANAGTIQKGGLIYAADNGVSNAYSVTLSPAPSSYTTGMIVNFIAANGNTTGVSTLNVNGLGAKTIKKQVTTDLITDDILAGQAVSVIYDGANFQMLSQLGNVAAGGGGLSGMQVFTTSNPAWTVPSGVTTVIAEAWGGGGGGGGGGAYYINAGGGGGGGGSGAYGKKAVTGLLPGSTIAITVGAGGSGGAAGAQGVTAPNGTSGGNSSVNGVVIAYGGSYGRGGGSGGNGFNGSVGSGGAGGTTTSGAFSVAGNSGSAGTIAGTGPAGAAVDYFQTMNLGAGGTGGRGGTSSPLATAGSTGSSGLIILYY